jgi:pimeloyl-ACP methyl ester carboxylesterase
MVDVGAGAPLVLIPGIQGRWEWMQPAIAVLSRGHRVITASLPGEPGSGMPFDADAEFDLFVTHIDRLLEASGVSSAIFCGISFGGLIALRYAAARSHRVRGLILVSTPGPRWKLNPRQARYARWPLLMSPLFVGGATRRGWRELRALYPRSGDRLKAGASAAWLVARAPAVPRRMSERARLAVRENFEPDCRRITAPTLIVAGDPDLDQVVPNEDTMRYLDLIPGSSFQLFERTGHLGTVLAPDRFGAIISRFARNL